MKSLDKVTFIIKTAGDGGLFDGNIFCGQHLAGAFDPIIIQIIDGRALRHAAEVAAEIFGIHSRDLGKAVKTDVIIIILCYIGEDILDGIQMPRGFRILYIFFVKMFFQNRADQLKQTALRHKFISGLPAGKGKTEIVHDRPDGRAQLGKKRAYRDLVVHDIVYIFGTRMIILHQDLKVKNNTVVDAGLILRITTVQRAIRNEDNVALVAGSDIVVQGHVKFAGKNADDLVMTMPVIGHIIAWAVRSLVVKSNGKIEGALLSLFFIIKIFHFTAVFLCLCK